MAVDNQVLQVQRSGAIAVIAITPVYFVGGFLKFRVDNRTATTFVTLPLFEVPRVDGATLWNLISSDLILNVTITPDHQENPWAIVMLSPAFYFWTISLILYSAVDVALGLWKIIDFSRNWGKFRYSVALYVLIIEIMSNLLRIAALIDIFGVFNIYTERTFAALTELSFPFAISSYMLFVLYWHEMMTNSSIVVHPFIVKMRIPFFVTAGVLLLLQIVRTILRNVTPLDNLSLVTAIAYLLVSISLIVFYAITGGKLLSRLHRSKQLGRIVRLRRSTIKILFSGGFILIFIIVAILFVAGLAYRPIGCLVIWYVLYTVADIASLMNILAFELPSRKASSGSGSSQVATTRSDRGSSTLAVKVGTMSDSI
jgi:hypothetical protein